MSVSEAFVKAGRIKAKARAIRLIKLHVPALFSPHQSEHRRAATLGLDFARELGRQHGFESDVERAIQIAFDILSPPSPVAADVHLVMKLAEQLHPPPTVEPPLPEAAE